MPLRTPSSLALVLAACTTTTRVSVAPPKLRDLAGMGPQDRRDIVPLGRNDPITVSGDDEIRVNESLGTLPASASLSGRNWARLDTLRWEPPKVAITAPGCAAPPCIESAPLNDVVSADIQITRPDWGTMLLVTGVVVGVVVLAVAVVVVPITVSLMTSPATNGR